MTNIHASYLGSIKTIKKSKSSAENLKKAREVLAIKVKAQKKIKSIEENTAIDIVNIEKQQNKVVNVDNS